MEELQHIINWPHRLSKSRIVALCEIPGEPAALKRARIGQHGGWYTPEDTVAARQWITVHIKNNARQLFLDEISAFGIRLIFHRTSRHRMDLDNMIKLVLDAITGVVWRDDNQVLEISARVVFTNAQVEGHTDIAIYNLGTKGKPTAKCKICGKEFLWYLSQKKRIYCSRRCMSIGFKRGADVFCTKCGKQFHISDSRKTQKGEQFCSRFCRDAFHIVTLLCIQCGREFQRPRSLNRAGRKYCSEECEASFWREQRKSAAKGVCSVCGGPTTKKSYKRCKACFIKVGTFRFKGHRPPACLGGAGSLAPTPGEEAPQSRASSESPRYKQFPASPKQS